MKEKILILFLIFSAFGVLAQDSAYPYPSLSPKGKISQIVGNTTIEIEYERPSVRKREIFGDLVPWGKLWRTGAGSCTKISFDKDVVVSGQNIEAGKYSIFTIPNPKEWIVILNRDTKLYGTYLHIPCLSPRTRPLVPLPLPARCDCPLREVSAQEESNLGQLNGQMIAGAPSTASLSPATPSNPWFVVKYKHGRRCHDERSARRHPQREC